MVCFLHGREGEDCAAATHTKRLGFLQVSGVGSLAYFAKKEKKKKREKKLKSEIH